MGSKFKVESTPINPKNEIATKTQSRQGSPRASLSATYSWCNFVPWRLGGKKILFGADSRFKVQTVISIRPCTKALKAPLGGLGVKPLGVKPPLGGWGVKRAWDLGINLRNIKVILKNVID